MIFVTTSWSKETILVLNVDYLIKETNIPLKIWQFKARRQYYHIGPPPNKG